MLKPNREAYVAEVVEWIGTRFAEGQWTKGVGCDCVGLLVGSSKALGMAPDADKMVQGYGQQPAARDIIAWCDHFMYRRNWDEAGDNDQLKLGDVLLFDLHVTDYPQHAAVYVGDNEIVHAYLDSTIHRTVKTSLDILREHVWCIYSYKEFED